MGLTPSEADSTALAVVLSTLKRFRINPAAAGRLDQRTPLGAAAARGIVPIVGWLVDECGADPNATALLRSD